MDLWSVGEGRKEGRKEGNKSHAKMAASSFLALELSTFGPFGSQLMRLGLGVSAITKSVWVKQYKQVRSNKA